MPRDSDNDGVPDYIEDADGDGQWDEDVETWIDTAYTESGVHDSRSGVYDDIDLDGDGMVGRIEKALSRNPLLWDNPLLLHDAGGHPEFRKFKLPLNYEFLTGIANVRLWFAGGAEPEIQLVLKENTDGTTLLVWDTTCDPAGQQLLQPKIYLKGGTPSEVGATTEASGPILPVQTDNAIQFESLYSVFDANGVILYAQTTPGTAYSIELRDMSGNHLKTITGTVDGPEIDVVWDLRCDGPGEPLFEGDLIVAAFSVTPPGSASQTRYRVYTRSALGYGDGPFTCAYSWNTWGRDGQRLVGRGYPLDNCIQFGAVEVLLNPTSDKRYTSIFNDFTPLHPNYYQYGGAGWIANPDRVEALLSDLARTDSPTRNFYWYGHGETDWIGLNPDINIWAKDVAARVGNDYEIVCPVIPGYPPGLPIITPRRNHPYRFVLIDGCYAAKTATWAEAFGIPGKAIRYEQLDNHPERAQAFLSFTDKVFCINTVTGCELYTYTLQAFFQLWMWNEPLTNCVRWCSYPDTLYDFWAFLLGYFWIPEEDLLPLGRPQATFKHRVFKYGSLSKIYGYPWITREGIVQPQ